MLMAKKGWSGSPGSLEQGVRSSVPVPRRSAGPVVRAAGHSFARVGMMGCAVPQSMTITGGRP